VDPRSTYLAGGGRPVANPQGDFLGDYISNLDIPGIFRSGKEKVKSAAAKAKESVKGLRTRYPNAGRYASGGSAVLAAVPGVMTAYEELQAGRPVGAAGAALGSIGAGGLTYAGTRLLGKGGVPGTIAGLGLMGLGALLPQGGAQAAEYTRQKVTGIPTAGKEGTPEATLDFLKKAYGIDLERTKELGEYERGALVNLTRDLNALQLDQFKAMAPEIAKFRNDELVRNQALMASRGNQLARLSLLQTGGALATGGQAETGATVRTMIQSNPYAAATVF
jgi:hypothetical protein